MNAEHLSPSALYGEPDRDLVERPDEAIQLSPFHEGAQDLDALADGALAEILIAAPPGSVERRAVLAHALRALQPGGRLVALAPKDKGGSRIRAELERFGCTVDESFRARQRICETTRPQALEGITDAIEAGAPRIVPETGLWSQPGVFSFDRIDPGSALLAAHLPALSGDGADLGAGTGFLSRAVLAQPSVEALHLVELDRRAFRCAEHNVVDPRARFHWADARKVPLAELDFVVTNPPFHAEGQEDHGLGQLFIAAAARMLRRSGTLWLVANRHLPYEAKLRAAFRTVETRVEEAGFKIFEARK